MSDVTLYRVVGHVEALKAVLPTGLSASEIDALLEKHVGAGLESILFPIAD